MNRITLERFLMTFNFRRVDNDGNQTTRTIRIFPNIGNFNIWFDLGIDDWIPDYDKLKIIRKYLSVNNLLNKYISYISIEESYGNILCVYLTNEKNMI